MLVSIMLSILIFGYAVFTLYRFIKRSKMGKCAGCAMNKSCSTMCSRPPIQDENILLSTTYSHIEK